MATSHLRRKAPNNELRSSRRGFLERLALVSGVVVVEPSNCVLAQDAFDRIAVDESLKGRLIFYTRSTHDVENAGLFVYDFETRKFARILKDVNPDLFCRASPDGKSFAVTEGSVANVIASIIRPEGRTKVTENRARIFWAPDGRRVIVSEWREDPLVSKTWRMKPDGTDRVSLSVPKDELVLDWSPDGRWLLVVRRDNDGDRRLGAGPNKPIFIRNVDGTEPRLLIEKNPGGSGLGRFSPDSRSVAYVRINHQNLEFGVRVIDVATSRERRILDGDDQGDPDGNLCWSPDGKFLAVRIKERKQDDLPEPRGHIEILDLRGRRIRWLGIPQKTPVPCNWL